MADLNWHMIGLSWVDGKENEGWAEINQEDFLRIVTNLQSASFARMKLFGEFIKPPQNETRRRSQGPTHSCPLGPVRGSVWP